MKRITGIACAIVGCFAISIVGATLPPDYSISQSISFTLTEFTDTTEGLWSPDKSATFQGGDINKFSNWVKTRLIYPAEASNASITGKVFVQFSVDTRGNVIEVRVVRSVHPLLDNEVVRVIKTSPVWKPAEHKGQLVKQYFVIPVAFALK